MPGIIGAAYDLDKNMFEGMQKRMYRSKHLNRHAISDPDYCAACYSLHSASRIFCDKQYSVIYDGYFLSCPVSVEEIPGWLINSFREKGELFAASLRGSFQIAFFVKENNTFTLYLYADQTASRPVFTAITKNGFCFCCEAAPLACIIEDPEIDNAAMVHFMSAGHFPSQKTMFRQIRLLGPGQYAVCRKSSQPVIKNYHNYVIEPDESIDENTAVCGLSDALDKVIMDCYSHSRHPAILLSGGYDSRYILYTIAEHIQSASALTTVTWGEPGKIWRSDVEAAAAIAKRFGTRHIFVERQTSSLMQDMPEMFKAQSGMTDSIAEHCHELEVCRMLREQHGIESFLRGDEVFGFGALIHEKQDGFLAIRQSLPQFIPDRNKWFSNDSEKLWTDFGELMRNKSAKFSQSANILKDTLYFSERLPMAIHFMNYYKYFFQDMYLPYLDPLILQITSRIPGRLRSDKKLFRLCVQNKYAKELAAVPLATRANLTNWSRIIRENTQIKSDLQKEIGLLPQYLNKSYFNSLLERVSTGRSNLTLRQRTKHFLEKLYLDHVLKFIARVINKKDRMDHTPDVFRIFRAVIISRWHLMSRGLP